MKGNTLLTVLVFLVASAILVALTFEVRESTYTCLECRATWHKRTVGGFDRSRIEENDYSRSVQARDSGHQHHWCRYSCSKGRTLFSFYYACGRAHSVTDVPVEYHAAYARAVSPADLAATLRDLDSKDRQISSAAVEKIFRVSSEAP